MTGEELAGANWLRTLQVSTCLRTMANDFTYVESTVRGWIQFSEEGHPFPEDERKELANKICAILEKLEKKVEVQLSGRTKFNDYVYSDTAKDWYAVFLTALPNLREEVLHAIDQKLRALPCPLWSDLLPEVFANQVLPPFRAGQYLSAVRRGCDALRAVIRTKTGIHHLDGADLINQAYGKDRPFMVAVWEGHSEDDVRRGYTDMLRGAMMGIRNPHHHGTEELPEMEAARLLLMLGTLWARADGTIRA